MREEQFEIVLNGGLGNQLFGWALGYAASQESGLTCRYNISRIEGRNFELSAFGIRGDKSEPFQLCRINNRLFQNLMKRIPNTLLNRHYIESGFHFQEKFLFPKNGVTYYGYFQSYKYFDKYSTQIKEILGSLQEPSQRFIQSCEYILMNKPFAVHIRRGDYLGRENYHGLTSVEYFESAMRMIRNSEASSNFILFSDSPLLTKNLLRDVVYLAEVTDSLSPAETLILMSLCKGIIGSNSSFSWWAAYLMESNSIRIFPRPWFTNSSLDTKDLLPSNWTQIDNS